MVKEKVQIRIFFDADLKSRLLVQAKRYNQTLAGFCRLLIVRELEKLEKNGGVKNQDG